MGKSKGQILISSIGYLLKAVWKLLLLTLYAIARITEALAGFVANILDKLIK